MIDPRAAALPEPQRIVERVRLCEEPASPRHRRDLVPVIASARWPTQAHALDDSLRLRQRGRARIDHACEMRELFDSYCNLAGPFADAEDASHRGAAYLIYCDAFRRLQERCRADAK